jgi:membrane protease YdiL (CAAX protease family)
MSDLSAGQRLLHHIEKPPIPYRLRGELTLALLVVPLAFIFQYLDMMYGKGGTPGESPAYVLLLSAFTGIAFASVFVAATPSGERQIRRLLAARRGTALLCALPLLYTGLFLLTLWLGGFPELQSAALKNVSGIWARLPLPLFLALAAALLYGGLGSGLALARRAAKKTAGPPQFGLRQFGCVLVTAVPYLVLQEVMPLLWCFSTPAALIVMVYGTGLGREYFGFTFVPRSRREAGFVVLLLAGGLLIFLAVTHLVGGIVYNGELWRMSLLKAYAFSFMMLFIVGISEEVIFRCGVLMLFATYLGHAGVDRWWGRHPRTAAVIATSALFGIAHFPHGPLMIFLAFLASLLYGLAFVGGRSLFGPVLLHGLLNVLILKNFQLLAF